MKILGRGKIYDFIRKHASSKKPLEAWVNEAERAAWQTPQDIRNRYGSADFLAGNRAIFTIKGNHYRLVVKIRYQNGIVVVEWVGTHAEYDKKRF
jgi:mRNA interferase HigB